MNILSMSILSRLMHDHSGTSNHPKKDSSREASHPVTSGASSTSNGSHESILVALSGSSLDGEVMALACTMARARHVAVVQVVYSIKVPRTLAVTDEMPAARAQAETALERASDEARRYDLAVEKEYIQSRDTGDCLVQVARSRSCALLVMGLSGDESDDEAEATETVDDVLRRAPCRVWVVRGQPLAA